MNEVFQNIMTFINENTMFLIGICVFLIFVLIGYLIDNSVKSKRVRKDIKNKDQVPEEIKNEIIKEAINEKKEKIMENSFHNAVREESQEVKSDEVDLEDKNTNLDETIKLELNFDEISSEGNDLNSSLNLDDSNISTPLALDNNMNTTLNLDLNNTAMDTPLDLNIGGDIVSEPLVLENNGLGENLIEPVAGVENNIVTENIETDTKENNNEITLTDPDASIMNVGIEDNKYKNDKKLSEILLNVDKQRVNSKIDNNIFEEKTVDIEVKNDINESAVEIEKQDDSSNELDKIMKKLSSMNNEEEDSYTNIF